MFLVQLISGENDDVDGAAGFAPGNSSVVMGSFNYRLPVNVAHALLLAAPAVVPTQKSFTRL